MQVLKELVTEIAEGFLSSLFTKLLVLVVFIFVLFAGGCVGINLAID